jgi:hypothetical protein
LPTAYPTLSLQLGKMLTSWLRSFMRRLRGERRHRPRENAEKVAYVNRQYDVALKVARKLRTTPEELLDYRRADRILARER